MRKLKDTILDAYEKGQIVFASIDGPKAMQLSDFIDQDADGILYDLNRGEETVLTFIDDPKWINDYAVAKTIRALKAKIDELKNDIDILNMV